ncbi:MAG: hypothetical protein QM752_02000 [Gammaproteobacteria bacterium]
MKKMILGLALGCGCLTAMASGFGTISVIYTPEVKPHLYQVTITGYNGLTPCGSYTTPINPLRPAVLSYGKPGSDVCTSGATSVEVEATDGSTSALNFFSPDSTFGACNVIATPRTVSSQVDLVNLSVDNQRSCLNDTSK